MKRVFFLSSLLCVFAVSKAQYNNLPVNAVKLNPLSLFLATGNVAYERATSETQSVQLGVFYSGARISDVRYSGFGITPEYRFYVAGHRRALDGVYAAPFLKYQNFTLEDRSNGDKATLSTFGGGALMGWQKLYESGFVLDLFAGPSINSGTAKDKSGAKDDVDVSSSISGFGVRAGIKLGFAF